MSLEDTAEIPMGSDANRKSRESEDPRPTFWSDHYDLRLQSFGAPILGEDDMRVLEGDLDGEVAVGYHRGGELVGVVLVGMASAAARYRAALTRAAATV
ncbi:oxidoreductase C-terminal domain-containing protein [Microbispora bryophytorum]|uniref:oxidoreductase C-terminal domain-containing protein n=1 Tax=Microbispora bryophytorum TaxID=1460882 RepID=UPI0034023C1B